jgi:hypothetical protein
MAEQQNFYKSPIVKAWLDTIPARGKTRAINAALERDILAQSEQQTYLSLLREAVQSLDNLHQVVAAFVDTVVQQ